MELQILHMIQGWRTDWLDHIMVLITKLGDEGLVWIALCVILLIFPRTRKCGVAMGLSLILTTILGNEIIKKIVQRPRPFVADTSVILLIPQPGQYSFPSGHTSNSVAAAFSIFLFYKKPGIAALVLAGLIAFSRMYLFVHYPTDILAGIVLGIVDALIIRFLIRKWDERKVRA
jgi:undecaprenyl-diphosphatase